MPGIAAEDEARFAGGKATGSALVVGVGPAGLMAAEELARAGLAVTLAEQMPSPGRKLLMAGKSGLNLTMDQERETFIAGFGPNLPEPVAAAVAAFGPREVIAWAEGLGQAVFTGSTGRVFPVVMKASPLLRAWLARLEALGVRVETRCRWTGWDGAAALLETAEGVRRHEADVVVLACGGASWPRLGSDGTWVPHVGPVTPFAPANAALVVEWSAHMAPHVGQPLKGIALQAGWARSRGEVTLSARGLEGSGIYAVSRAVREGAALTLDLAPDLEVETLRARLSRGGRQSLTNRLRRAAGFDALRIALLHEWGRPLPDDVAPLLKALPVRHRGLAPLAEAISTAGGLSFEGLTPDLMLRARPGVFAAGEMLDWEAPTGGWLITASLATGRMAGRAAAAFAAGAA